MLKLQLTKVVVAVEDVVELCVNNIEVHVEFVVSCIEVAGEDPTCAMLV